VSEENKRLLQRWMDEVWNQGSRETISELLVEDVIIHGLAGKDGAPLKGRQGFLDFHEQFRGAFPNVTVTVEDLVAEGDLVVARCSVTGTHTGDDLGLKATQSPVEFDGMVIVRIKDGQFIEAWNNFDFLKMNQQLGVF
jgi:steroid delta-isomerase-like uncharacterized protein